MSTSRDASLLLALFLLTVLAFSCFQIFSIDLGIHLTYGKFIAEHGEIPTKNVFSYVNRDHPLHNDKWLFQILIHGVYTAWGVSGLYLLRITATLAVFSLLWKTVRLSAGPVLTVVLCLAALVVSFERLTLRPELISLLLAAAYLFMLERGRVQGWDRSHWTLIALQILWVNLHVYFVVGIVLVLAYLVGGLLQRAGRGFLREIAPGEPTPRWLWWLVLVLVAVALVNPRGARGAIYPFVILRDFAGDWAILLKIGGEFRGPLEGSADTLHIQLFKLMAASGLASAVVVHRRLSLAQVLVFLALLAHALSMRRNLPFFALAAAPLLGRNLTIVGENMGQWLTQNLGERLPAIRATAVVVLCVAMLLLSWWVLTDGFYLLERVPHRCGFGFSDLTYPARAVDFILHVQPEGQVFNSIDVGGYFLWRTYPAKLPFITGDLAGYDLDFLLKYPQIAKGREDFNAVADEYGIGYTLLDHTQPHADPLIKSLYDHPQWTLVWLDGKSIVFFRETLGNRIIIEENQLDLSSVAWREEVLASSEPTAFDAWVPHRARSPTHALGLGRVLCVLGEFAVAESVFAEAQERWPSEKLIPPSLGWIYLTTERWEEAEEILLSSLEQGDSEMVRSYLGELYLRCGRTPEALEQFEVGLAKSPENPELRLGQAVALRGMDRQDEAARVLNNIVERDPNHEGARLELGNICSAAGDYYGAAEHYAHLAKLRPRDANLHRLLGLIYARRLGMHERALSHLRKSLELGLDQPYVVEVEREISRIEGRPGVQLLDLPGSGR